MKYYIIAGEASGDLHGSNLIKELKKQDAQADIRCWGGDLMQAAGATVVKHYKDLAFMGFAEVLMNLRTIFRNLDFCKQDILDYQPDALILIDYPGFNMRIAKWAHQQRFRTTTAPTPATTQGSPAGGPAFRIIYYISPQVWAWKENRVKQIRECVDKMLVILPFEKEFYRKWNYDVEYVGHPLVEVIDGYQAPAGAIPAFSKPVIALLPGSRKQEILKKLPVMLKVSESFCEYQFVVAQAPGQDQNFYNELLAPYPNVATVTNQTYALLQTAQAACVTSGTATLETALFGVPEVVCYKGSNISYQIARRLIKVKYISLVNLIMDKLVVRELIQDDLTPANLRRELNTLLQDNSRRQQLASDYRDLRHLLSQGGHASANAARSILHYLRELSTANHPPRPTSLP
ncbi:lipid-A-disaccharide synthase [Puia dinghuensis]|uniref:Lipid-A-disaccharide synthase n=1 Tax=Puia dinghuensis TaxID=1792502 RepID=A0A8J2UGR7_9BACT|nr:lipid-A-disaccharide synthase [Puia dinghuensis]GGB15407.1 lipid-A-disaccharide synthase [Puia dinghuensis]